MLVRPAHFPDILRIRFTSFFLLFIDFLVQYSIKCCKVISLIGITDVKCLEGYYVRSTLPPPLDGVWQDTGRMLGMA
jgi:hypothetical protein